MRVIIFGASGMVGQGVLRECLNDPGVESVLTVVRASLKMSSVAKLKELVHKNFEDYASVESQLAGYDACFFCLGTTSAGKAEDEYTKITYGYTLAAAQTLVRLNPGMTFVYVSGAGADSSEKSRVMWARVRGRTENALLRLAFKAVYIFRPSFIEPLDGIRSRTPWIDVLYRVVKPVTPVLRAIMPDSMSTTRSIGQAMLAAARRGAPKKVLSVKDIEALARPT